MVRVAIKLKMQQDNLWVIIDYLQIIVRLAVVMLQGYLHLLMDLKLRGVLEVILQGIMALAIV
ncbi:hypothetical protein Tanf_10490 [Tannerella forsythia]|nr:hypothetical protein Tanf_10490 [Tannerella forsythia]